MAMLTLAALMALTIAVNPTPAWAQDAPAAAPAAAAPAPVKPSDICLPDLCGCDSLCKPTTCDPYPCCTCKQAKDPTCPPKYNNLRFAENWRPCLCKKCGSWGDVTDKLKARRLDGGRGALWANVGGQMRFRWESFSGIGFGAPADPNDAWMLGRIRAHADLHVGTFARIFTEVIYADQWETRELGARAIDKNRGDLLNLFGEIQGNVMGGKAGLWVGRHELQTAKQRLVSPLDWANTRRTFQGLGGWYKRGFQTLQAWVTHPVVIDKDAFDDDWNDDVTFWGADYENAALNCLTWGAYVYGLNVDTPALNHNRYTIGARIDGRIGGTRWDYDAEAAWQLGDVNNDDISAYMASLTLGYKPCVACYDPRLAVGFDIASGDDDPNDSSVGTFNQLFPLGHKYLGHADLIGRQNVVAARIEGHVKLAKKLSLSAWFHMFWRADTADAAYNAGGGILRAPGGNTDSAVGTELDIMLKYKIDRHWVAFIEWAHFTPGDFIDNTGAHDNVDVVYLSAQATF